MIRFEQLPAAELIRELRCYASDIESEGRVNAPACMREAARRLQTVVGGDTPIHECTDDKPTGAYADYTLSPDNRKHGGGEP